MTTQRIIPQKLQTADYEYPADRAALQALKTLKPLEYIGRFFIKEFAEPWLASKLFGLGIKVTKTQVPQIMKLAQEAADILHIEPPDIFIHQQPFLNAYTLGVQDRNVVVLHHSLMDALTDDELLFILGHEMGHIKSEHVLYHTLSYWMSEGVSIFIRWALIPAQTALWTWQRKSEITADRAGLIVVQDIDIACSALVKIALGSKELFQSINISEYVRDQLLELTQNPVKTWPELFQDHPYIPKRLGHLISFSQSEAYTRLWP